MDSDLSVVVFCCAEYRDLAQSCCDTADQCIQDNVARRILVSNCRIDIPGWELILDDDFWRLIDPGFEYGDLYNTNHVRQQIFKLNVDRVCQGKILIVDAEVVFLRPMHCLHQGLVDIYPSSFSPIYEPHFRFIQQSLGLEDRYPHSFISDLMVFDSTILAEIRERTQAHCQKSWLDVYRLLLKDREQCTISEFELYGNYLVSMHPDMINQIRDPQLHVMVMDHRRCLSLSELTDQLRTLTSASYISVNVNEHSWNSRKTAWLTFYSRVRDPSWPDCDDEKNFQQLPQHIQQECKEIFGYPECLTQYPGDHNGKTL